MVGEEAEDSLLERIPHSGGYAECLPCLFAKPDRQPASLPLMRESAPGSLCWLHLAVPARDERKNENRITKERRIVKRYLETQARLV